MSKITAPLDNAFLIYLRNSKHLLKGVINGHAHSHSEQHISAIRGQVIRQRLQRTVRFDRSNRRNQRTRNPNCKKIIIREPGKGVITGLLSCNFLFPGRSPGLLYVKQLKYACSTVYFEMLILCPVIGLVMLINMDKQVCVTLFRGNNNCSIPPRQISPPHLRVSH